MNKAFMVGLSLALILSLSACGNTATEESNNSSQDTSTPEVTQPVDTSTPEVEQTAQTVQETPPVEETPTAEETPAPTETTEQSTPEAQLFTDCNETVYATTTVNVRDTYSTSGNKLGSLTKAQSVTRTGTGQGEAAGWSRIEFNGQVAYVSSDYLSTTKPSTSSSSGGSSGGSTQTSKPSTSTGFSSSSGGSSSSGSSSSGGNSYSKPFTPTGGHTRGNETLDKDDMTGDGTGNNDDSGVSGYYDPNTGEFYYGNP